MSATVLLHCCNVQLWYLLVISTPPLYHNNCLFLDVVVALVWVAQTHVAYSNVDLTTTWYAVSDWVVFTSVRFSDRCLCDTVACRTEVMDG